MVKEITLTQGKVAIVDDCDYEELIKHKWYAHAMGRKKIFYYAIRQEARSRQIQMHNAILPHTGHSLVVDHIDGDSLNNRRNNLRLVTLRQNCQNRHHKKTSKYCGVSWYKRKCKWGADITINGRNHNLGLFEIEEDARDAYNDRVKRLLPSEHP
jgi:hypothetical protein